MTIEGYIIDFIMKLNQYFSREEEHFLAKPSCAIEFQPQGWDFG
jgi:hypothetical protein